MILSKRLWEQSSLSGTLGDRLKHLLEENYFVARVENIFKRTIETGAKKKTDFG